MNLLQLSWKNLVNKPLAMLLSLVLFGLGVGLISLLLLVNKQLEDKFEKNLAHINLVIGAKGSPLQLILASMYHIDSPTGNIAIDKVKAFLNPRNPFVKTAVPLSLGDSYRGFRIVGTTAAFFNLYAAKIAKGKTFAQVMEVVAGAGAAQELGLNVGSTFKSSHGFIVDDNLVHADAEGFKVVGILEPTGTVADQLLLTPAQSIWAVHEHDASHSGAGADDHSIRPLTNYLDKNITSVLLQFKGRNVQTLNMQRSINENTDLQAATPALEISRLYSMMGIGADALRWIALVIMAVSGLSIFISLYSSLQDRKYELALMRTLGASPLKIFSLIVLEGQLLAVMGFAIGIMLSHTGMQWIAGAMKNQYRYAFSSWIWLPEEGILLAAALGIGLLAAILPAIQASRTDISTTLASE
jgi:putative ABC transport system permease protein